MGHRISEGFDNEPLQALQSAEEEKERISLEFGLPDKINVVKY